MPALEKTKWELFAQNVFQGKPLGECAITAGYSPRTCSAIATSLLKKTEISQRIKELHEQSANAVVMSVAERKAKLSSIARSEWQNKDGVTPVPNISAINTLNKMDNLYKHDPMIQDNRSLTINVLDKRTQGLLASVIDGQYKVLPLGKGADDNAPLDSDARPNIGDNAPASGIV